MTREEKLEQLERVETASRDLEEQMRVGSMVAAEEKRWEFAAVFSALSTNCKSIEMLTKAVIKLVEDKDSNNDPRREN